MGTARTLAEWARQEPGAREALLALADQAVALQPAAEAVIQWCQLEHELAPAQAEEGSRVERAYRELGERLAGLDADPVAAAPLASLLARHLELVRRALEGPTVPEGLGRVAGELVGLRDLLRRSGRLRGRSVADVPEL